MEADNCIILWTFVIANAVSNMVLAAEICDFCGAKHLCGSKPQGSYIHLTMEADNCIFAVAYKTLLYFTSYICKNQEDKTKRSVHCCTDQFF